MEELKVLWTLEEISLDTTLAMSPTKMKMQVEGPGHYPVKASLYLLHMLFSLPSYSQWSSVVFAPTQSTMFLSL